MIVTQEYCTLIPPALGFGGNTLETQGFRDSGFEIRGFGGSAPEKRGFRGGAPEEKFWDVCWPTVLRTHGIGLTLEFFHCISPIKRKHCKMTEYGIVLYWKRDCESVNRKCAVLLQGVSLHLSRL